MSETSEKVEFFHSESSFGSQSELSDSRYYDFTNQIIAQTDNVFHTLHKDLIPSEGEVQWDKINYILSRGRLMYKDTIPEHLNYLRRINAPGDAQSQVQECSQRLRKLLDDHERYQKGTMIYKQFYNLYSPVGMGLEGGFSRKKEAYEANGPDSVLEPEYVQINYHTSRAYNATPRVIIPNQSAVSNDKELAQLKAENKTLREGFDKTKRQHELELTRQKLQFERRLQNYLKGVGRGEETSEAVEQSKKLEEYLEANKRLQQKVEEQSKTIQNLRIDNISLKSQVEVLRKLQLDLAEQKQHDMSVHSIDVNESSDRKAQKRLRNLLQENKLLKAQLKTERDKHYRLASELTEDEKNQLSRNRKAVERKGKELEEAYQHLDKARIQLLQLQHSSKADRVQNQTLRNQNIQLKTSLTKASQSQQERISLPPGPVSRQNLDFSRMKSSKVSVQAYEGDGIEGYPYYELLNRQFRVRFRRACLREKELLYKANGVEIGVISKYEKPNKINFTLFVTNCGNEVEDEIRLLKGKVMNANENFIQGGTFEFERIQTNEQIKIPITMSISRYPLGPLILLLEFTNRSKEEVRILLPGHVFKTMRVEERAEPLKNPKHILIPAQRKIAKDINDFKGYLQGVQPREGKLKVAFHNEQTHSVLVADISSSKDGFEISYEHSAGNEAVTDYFISTLAFLLRK